MSLQSPYFSLGLPTRNRGPIAEQVVQYVLNQKFQDFELIVADSDETDDTLNRVKRFHDPRIRYYNTRGKTGPENFQFCAEQARGEYFLLLTDRMMLRPYALEVLFQHSEARRYPSMRYAYETFDDRKSSPKIWKPEGSSGNRLVTADELLSKFTGEYNVAEFIRSIPLPQFSAIHHSLLKKIRGTESRPVFGPIVPDMWCIFAQLSCCEGEILNIDQMLSVFVLRLGVFFSFQLKKESGAQVLREICKNGELALENVPIKAHLIDNFIYSDYLRAQKLYGGRLLDYPLSPATYFFGLHSSITGSTKVGVNMRPEYLEWKRALSKQPAEVRKEVRRRLDSEKSFARMEANRLLKKARYALGIHHLESSLKSLRPSKKKNAVPSFKTVAEYMADDASQSSAEPAAKK